MTECHKIGCIVVSADSLWRRQCLHVDRLADGSLVSVGHILCPWPVRLPRVADKVTLFFQHQWKDLEFVSNEPGQDATFFQPKDILTRQDPRS